MSQEISISHGTGDCVFQLRKIWERIQRLQMHLKVNKKDYYCKLALAKLLSKRRRFLNYLKKASPEEYKTIMREHSLHKKGASVS